MDLTESKIVYNITTLKKNKGEIKSYYKSNEMSLRITY